MEENVITKSNKLKLIVLTTTILLVTLIGVTYAYFAIQVVGNETASSMKVLTANKNLIYNDVQIVSDELVEPGWSDTKTLTVQNTGNVPADFIIKFRELTNTIINGELVLSATCTASTGTCDALPERAVHSAATEITNAYMYGPYTIPAGVTYTYTLTVEFKETGSRQSYNKGKSFIGTLNIGDGTPTPESCFTTSGAQITTYTCNNTDIILPKTIGGTTMTSIANETFKQKGLTSVVIPEGYTTLGQYSFNDNQLTSIVLPNTLTTLGRAAFDTNQLTSAAIPSRVSTIGRAAFANNQLMSAAISSGVTTIKLYAFHNNLLTSVIIPNSVTAIENAAFQDNQLTSITIPNGVTTISTAAFRRNQLTSVVIPSNVTTIGEGAFRVNQLSSVVIPSNVTTINNYAFLENQLTSVTIEGKSSSSQFTTYGTNIWGWKSGITCTTNNTSNVTNGCITWLGN